MIRRYLPKNVEELTRWYMRWVSPVWLVAGFLVDNFFLLRRVDVWTSNALLSFHLIVAGTSIVLLNLAEAGHLQGRRALKIVPFLPVATQFSLGALFSAFLSLYGRSAAFATSWVFIIILAALIILNERFVHFYMRTEVQIAAYFTVLFSFFIFSVPLIVHDMGPDIFLLSGGVSLVIIAGFLWLLERLAPEIVRSKRTHLARVVASICVLINICYFTGAIPPLPLALKEAGVYHNVARSGDTYTLSYEPVPWYQSYLTYETTYRRTTGEPVYVYTAIFAPTGLAATMYHQWQQYDEAGKEWNTVATVPFYVVGGRDGGYRGYSMKSTGLADGKWRVNVVTDYGQAIGRVSFVIQTVNTVVPVESKER